MTISDSRPGLDDWTVLFSAGAVGILSDAELLARFAGSRGGPQAEAAFAALVGRHGPLVLGVCRRVTGDAHSADDAFQAVFLVLARKGYSIRLGPDDSLGRWLHGVSLRVARRARASAKGRIGSTRGLGDLDPIDPASPEDPCERADLRLAIDAEIARLPARYRGAVVLCYLEGLSQEQAARRLRCPVGTVQSRLHRARERLRSGLARRGLAPSVGAALVGSFEQTSRAAVPPGLARGTAAAAARVGAGEGVAGASSATVAGLVGSFSRGMIMRQSAKIATLVALGLVASAGAFALATGPGDDPKAPPRADAPKPVADAPRADPPLAEEFDRLKAEYQAANRKFHEFYRGSTIPEKDMARAIAAQPDFPKLVRRIADLAAPSPKDPAVRDVMLWVIQHHMGGQGPDYAQFAQAAGWLVQHFGDDPDAIRIGLDLDGAPNAHRDHLLLGFYASAESRESKGLARLALAQYFERKSKFAEGARKVQGRPMITHDDIVAADGSLYTVKELQPVEDYAYLLHLKQCDPAYLRDEAERLYDEVIAGYGDVPHVRARDRMLEALLKQPDPRWNGEPLAEEERRKIADRLAASRSTLGQVAEGRLDDWHNLAVGKPAPEFRGLDLLGNPMALSDYRGQVVVLAFWGSWCGPCVREIPREKALADRMKGRPFALLGVNTDDDLPAARKAVEAHGVTWPNWHDGPPDQGPIARLYHVRGYPTVYAIDPEGRIRSKKAHGEALDRLAEELVAEREAATK